MPVYNLTIDDVSPLIVYSTGWGDSSHTDSLWSSYTHGTFHATEQQNATASLTFNGSAVYLYGAKRDNHDVYSVTLDNAAPTTGNGHANPNVFNSSLFSATGLSSSEHQLVLQNAYTTKDPSWVDVDFVTITAGDGNPQTQRVDTTWDDGVSAITYGGGTWQTTPNGLEGQYYQSTMHRTDEHGAWANITFVGNAIAVYGATSGNHGVFSVVRDGGPPVTLNGSATAFRPQNLLYWAGGLDNNTHTVTLTNTDSNKNWFDLDKVIISSWYASTIPANVTTSQSPSASSSSKPAVTVNPAPPAPSGAAPSAPTQFKGPPPVGSSSSAASPSPSATSGASSRKVSKGFVLGGMLTVAIFALASAM